MQMLQKIFIQTHNFRGIPSLKYPKKKMTKGHTQWMWAIFMLLIMFGTTLQAQGSEMDVQGGSPLVSIPDGDTTPQAADGTDFGDVNIFGGSVSRTFTIANSGGSDLTLSGTPIVQVSGANGADFSVTQQPASPVTASGTTTFTIEFNASAAGVRSATVSIDNNDGDENPYDFTIQGNGIANPRPDNLAYVTNSGSGTVSVIDPATNTVEATIPVGVFPRGITLTPNGDFAYVANFNSDNVSVINTATNAVEATVLTQRPDDVAVSPDGSLVYVSTLFQGVVVINTATNSVITNIPVGTSPGGIVFSLDGVFAYVANFSSANVSVIATATNTVVATIPVGTSPTELEITPDGSQIYVVNQGNNTVSVINTATNTVVATVTGVGSVAVGIDISPDGTFAYVSNAGPNTVSVINTATNTVVATGGPTGNDPFGLAVTPDGAFVYTANRLGGNVTVINTATNTTVIDISVGNAPWDVAVSGSLPKPEMDVQGGSPLVSILDGDTTPQAADGTDFGDVNIFGGSVSRTFTIANSGGSDLTLSGTPIVQVSGANGADFSVTQQPASPVTASGTTTFTIEFNASAAGVRSATVSIDNNDGDENPYDFTIQGNGIANPRPDNLAYVTNSGSGTVSVIDPATNTVEATIPVGVFPRGITLTPNGDFAYVANFNSDNVSVINTATNAVEATVLTQRPDDVAVSPDGSLVYVSTLFQGVVVINTATNSVITNIPVGTSPGGIVFSLDGVFAYVANFSSANVSVIATATNTVVATIPVGTSPTELEITPDGSQIYVVNQGNNTVSVINTATNTVVATVTGVGSVAVGIDISPDGTFAYVSNAGPNTVSVINTATNTVVATGGPTGNDPFGLAVTPDGAFVYTANRLGGNVTVINTATNTTVIDISVGNAPWDVAFPAAPKPEIDVQGGDSNTSISDGDDKPRTKDGTKFGKTDVNSGAVAHIFTIRNTGSGTLNITGDVTIGGRDAADFSVTQQPAGAIAPNETTTFEVTFDPTDKGTRKATVNIPNSDSDENPYDFAIKGKGTGTVTSTCQITDLSAGPQTPCDPQTNTYTQEVTVTYQDPPSKGNLKVNGQSFAISGSPQTVTLAGLVSNGQPVTVTASFSKDSNCSRTVEDLFTAPQSCGTPGGSHTFTILAEKLIEVSKKGTVTEGDFHSNDLIQFSDGDGTHTGNLTAVANIEIGKDMTVNGDVTAPTVDNSGTVNGTITEGPVTAIALPTIAAFPTNGNNIVVDKNDVLALTPGTYGEVDVNKKGTLQLSPGVYNFAQLDLGKSARLAVNAGSAVTINVKDDISFSEKAEMELTDGSTQNITVNCDNSKVKLSKQSVFLGNLIAPDAKVDMKKDAYLKGSICAKEVVLSKGSQVVNQGSNALPKITPDDPEDLLANIPTEYALDQNFPNPFNPSTTIRFALPEAADIQVRIYNIRGQLVRTLAKSSLKAGIHELTWDATNDHGVQVASGFYFYQLQSRDFNQVKRMLLIK